MPHTAQGPVQAVVTEGQHRSNNFDALRLFGALLVIVGHAYELLGRRADLPSLLGHRLQTIGVIIFFCVSGYLIAGSWERTRHPFSYFLARCLRIFPALLVVVLVTALALGPMVTVLSLQDYLVSPDTRSYILDNVALRVQFGLPGVWGDLPYPGAVNGSLWTLAVEFACYLAVPLFFFVPKAARPAAWLLVGVVCIYWALEPQQDSPVIYHVRLRDAAAMWVFFAGGAFLHAMRSRWDVLRADVAVLGFTMFALVTLVAPDHALWVAWLTVPYAVLTAGLARTPVLCHASRFGDFSYGLYLWAFPVQQLVVDLWGPQRMSVNLLVVTGVTLVLAVLTWHMVERPALWLKTRVQLRLATVIRPGAVPVPTQP